MSPAAARRPLEATDALATVVLAAAVAFVALFSSLPVEVAVGLGVGLVAASAVARRLTADEPRGVAGAPALAGLGVVAATAPTSAPAELAAGVAALAFLLWLAAAPAVRPAGAVRRSLLSLSFAALVLLLAWSSALLLPPNPASFGIGGALLVAVMIVVAILVGRPELIDREPGASS